MSQQSPRRRFGGEQLFIWYLATAAAAAVVGVVAGGVGLLVLSALRIGCRPTGGDVLPGGELQCPDGTGKVLPALVFAGLGCVVVLAVAAELLSRRGDASTVARVARHGLWLAAWVVALPGLAWVSVVSTSAATRQAFWGVVVGVCAAIAFVAIPLVTSYVRPAYATVVLAACLAVPATAVLVGLWLPLVVPLALPVTAIWLVALWLSRAAHRISVTSAASQVSGP
ncbi:adenylate cyclase [Solwaraspora sp. WMMD937]|uniref:adenylate cyclase n=1 Tax=Solwaraspora sp. WMMD937 TaxID=3016090 RepID=UPI00249BA505|nr:adenylate cyclase [Solwaraspora sp. WMMD937]WFE20266.1 adenylate cyclase [Solwaraspora sp. WMMD937]